MSTTRTSGLPVRDHIEGKVIVITGASSGLGEAAARLFPKKERLLSWPPGVPTESSH